MGEDKAVTDPVEVSTIVEVDTKTEVLEVVPVNTDELEGAEVKVEDNDGNEIFLDGDEGSQPKVDEQHGIRKRINKLNAKVAVAAAGQDESNAALEVERERNKLLQLALDQRNGTTAVEGPPNPDDFDDGHVDPKYTKAFSAYIQKDIIASSEATQRENQATSAASSELETRQTAHYKRADELKVADFDDTEDKAILILGKEVTNQIISASDKSPELLYWLGKNPGEAEVIANLIRINPVKGVLKIGALEARLKSRPKAKTVTAPNPDEELRGATLGSSSANDRKLDKLRTAAASGGQKEMSALMEFKRALRAK
jgi:hypothetical protein